MICQVSLEFYENKQFHFDNIKKLLTRLWYSAYMEGSPKGSLVIIEGLDGSGKSTAAQEVAHTVSQERPTAHIAVTDSTGLYKYKNGELTEHRFSTLAKLEPTDADNSVQTLGKLGVFTAARKYVDYVASQSSDLLISVRDPDRVDPATYASVYLPGLLGKLSATQRLRFFDRFTYSKYPDAIISLTVSPDDAKANISVREERCHHETDESFTQIAEELPLVLRAFTRLYGTPVHEVEGLKHDTAEHAIVKIKPLL